MSTEQEMEAVFEAVLFVTPEPVPRPKLLSLFAERDKEAAEEALDRVLDRYRQGEGENEDESGRGVMVDEVAGGIRLVTRPELHEFLRRFFEISGNNKLTMAGLETLAIIAYRQPMTGPEIQELRGKNSSGVLKTLLERRMIRISGRKEVVGKPFLYSTTRDFLLHFGLKNLKDLPPLEEFEETFLSEGGSLEPDDEELAMQQLALVEDAEAEAGDENDSDVTEAEDSQDDGEPPEDRSAGSPDPMSEVEVAPSNGTPTDPVAEGDEADSDKMHREASEASADVPSDVDDTSNSGSPFNSSGTDHTDLAPNAGSESVEESMITEGGELTNDSGPDGGDDTSIGRVLEMPANPPEDVDASPDEEE